MISKSNNKKLKIFLNKYIVNFLIAGFGFLHLTAQAQIYSIPLEQRNQYNTIEKHLTEKKRSGKLFAGSEEVVTVIKNNEDKIPYYSDVQIRKLNELLANEDYSNFFDYFSSIVVNDKAPIKYLLSKTNEGHIPLFWLMSNTYAFDSDAFNTHKWLYVALIMTTQDSRICLDSTAVTAPKNLLREFPKILSITTRTPQHIKPAVEDATRFIRSLKNRTNPKWVCTYGTGIINSYKTTTTYEPSTWELTRKDVLLEFLAPYQLK